MTDPFRNMARAARHFADRHSERITGAADATFFHATVTAVAPGMAADKVHALVQVTYRGTAMTAAGYDRDGTPLAVGDRVFCCVTKYHSLEIIHCSVGAP